jgi:hypothetical protein
MTLKNKYDDITTERECENIKNAVIRTADQVIGEKSLTGIKNGLMIAKRL